MTSHHKQQQESEYLICNSFLNIYNGLSGTKIEFVTHGDTDKNEPDCICTDNIAIEITSAQDNSYQSEKIHSKKPVRQQPRFELNSLQNLEQIIFQKLNKLEIGNYSGVTGKIILVCNLESPLIKDKNIDLFIENFAPFSQDNYLEKYFDETWLYWKSENGGDIKIKKIKI